MLNNSSKIMFILILMMGTMITVSANSWLSAWMGLEINLLSFIPLMSDNNNLMSTESSLKYFLIQALASATLLFAIILILLENKFLNFYSSYYMNLIILSSLLLKSGTAPFHFWFPNIMEGLTWMNSLILMTWQKIAPLMLISYMIIKPMFMFCIILSIFFGSLGGLNQTSLRKIMAFSSINHLGWMLAAMFTSEILWITYFLFYCFLSFNMIFMFNKFDLSQINQVYSMFMNSKILKMFLFCNLLSLGGLPPFLGFIPKWLVIQSLSINNQLFLLILMVSMTLITLYFYIRICFASFMLNYYETNWKFKNEFNFIQQNLFFMFSSFSNFGLILISTIYFLF